MQSSKALQHRYDRSYFYGGRSGYPKEGYAIGHPDWKPWLDFLGLVKPSGVLIDLGCAYGYLVEQARRRGYQSFGFDVSSYALAQEPGFRSGLGQAHLQKLPLRQECADVLTLFDVLEHLENPLECLAESVRVLKRDGLIMGTTPDPIFFSKKEETHCFERPPSFWVAALQKLGLKVQFRFSVEASNFQFLAAFAGSDTAQKIGIFQHDFFGPQEDFITLAGPVTALPRFGWGVLENKKRTVEKTPASLYLLNLDRNPLRLRIGCVIKNSPDFSMLRLRLDSHPLQEIHLSSEETIHQVELPEVVLPCGGHHLFFDLSPGGPKVSIGDLSVKAEAALSEELTLGLPFDLYQRYRLASEIAACLSPSNLLDVGGYLGDQYGHVANTQDFFPNLEVQTTDLRQCDHPDHTPALACEQPFANESFDLVISLDVLEHLPPERRSNFLAELDRLSSSWILLGAPFASREVERAEKELAQHLMAGQQFLREHRQWGLPKSSLVEEFFTRERAYEVYSFPGGYLPRWKEMQILTQHYFRFKDYVAIQTFNRLYNRMFYSFDRAEPAYRKMFLISKKPLSDAQQFGLTALRTLNPQPRRLLSEEPAFLALHERIADLTDAREKALRDVQFLVNERQKLIGILENDLNQTPLWKLAWRRLRKLL